MSHIINVEALLVLVQERPELWDPQDSNYQNRLVKDASWTYICRQLFPNYAESPPDVQIRLMNDVTRRWRSCRDQYRRERQLRQQSGSGAIKKRPYLYMSQLNFLSRIIDLRPTDSNIRETDTGSEAEARTSQHEERRPWEDVVPGASAEEGADPPNTTEDAAQQEEQARSSSPTLPLYSSPQASIPQRMRRRREAHNLGTRREIDRRVMDYIGRTISDDGEEAFCRSLAQHLRRIPIDLRLNTKTCIMHLIHAATPPQNPREIFQIIERQHQLSECPNASSSAAAHGHDTCESQESAISRPTNDSGRASSSDISTQSWQRHMSVEGQFGQEHGNIGQPPTFVGYSNHTITNLPPTNTMQAWPPYPRHYGHQGQYGPQNRAANVFGQGEGWVPRGPHQHSNIAQHSNIFHHPQTQEAAFYSQGPVDYVPSHQQPIRTQNNPPPAITQNPTHQQSTVPENRSINISTSSPTTSHQSFIDL
ncbi:uncharacterized protein [Ranitomeya imitator]|uniref:uncharacterized protein n=1 Tax=Ranitomeya imitator TaxID=111125 RepID=UPI0037E795A6